MNRIVKAFIISLAFTGIGLTFSWLLIKERKGPLIHASRDSILFSATGTVSISSGSGNIPGTIAVLKRRIAGYCNHFSLNTKNDSVFTLLADGVKDTLLFHELLSSNGSLELYETYSLDDILPSFRYADSLIHLKIKDSIARHPSTEQDSDISKLLSQKPATAEPDTIIYTARHPLLYMLHVAQLKTSVDAEVGSVRPGDTTLLNACLKDPQVAAIMPYTTEFLYSKPYNPDDPGSHIALYAIRKGEPQYRLDQSFIIDAGILPINSYEGECMFFQFDKAGSELFERMTRLNTGRHIAFLVNGEVAALPMIDHPIAGGKCKLVGDLTHQDYQFLSTTLKYGPLPVPVTIQHLSFTLTGLVGSPRAQLLLVTITSLVVFFAVFLFLGKALHNAKALGRPQNGE